MHSMYKIFNHAIFIHMVNKAAKNYQVPNKHEENK